MRILLGLLAVFIGLPLAVACYLIMSPIWRGNERLAALQARVYAHPRPPQTQVDPPGEDDATVGKLGDASGDYCEYLVKMTISTALPAEKILAHYSKARIPGVNKKDLARVSVQLEGSIAGTDRQRAIIEVRDVEGSDWDFRCT
ncbi:hypothetical protein AB0K48_19225 [Nonomuraea sp. NPDC055795]